MVNILKADMYKAKKSKMFRNLMITSIMLAVVCIIIQNFATEGGMSVAGEIDGKVYGFVTGIIEKSTASGILDYFYSSMGMNFSMIILVLLLATSNINNEYLHGTYKNSVSYGVSRVEIIVSKIVVTAIQILCILGTFTLITLFFNIILHGLGDTKLISGILEVGRFIIVDWIILSLIASMTMTGTIIIKSNAVIVGSGIAAIMVTVMFGGIIPVEYQRINPIFMLMELCGEPPTMNTILLLSGLAIVELVVINTISCVIFKKEDIK